ncbi:class I SAM-dependent methyltransferase [Kribbella sp. NPDC004536]|uniref:class I SAM-dependent methyltransferase n=1 Tax=Kribbella sp. NPDC004536 TaxID=3364106 RepID=UPI0036D1A6DB
MLSEEVAAHGLEVGCRPRRIEIFFDRAAGATYLCSGAGGAATGWHAILLATPDFTFHLKNGIRADLPARATPVTDPAERRALLVEVVADLSQPHDPGTIRPTRLEDWADSRLMCISFRPLGRDRGPSRIYFRAVCWGCQTPGMSEHTARALRLFDELAAGYDEVLPFFRGFAGLQVGWLDPVAGTVALDLGAGGGALTGALLGRGCVVTAVDGAPGMVAKVARLYPEAEVRLMEAGRLEFADASFDLVCAGFVMHLLDDPAVAAAEVRRVLRPGGVFSFSTPCAVEDAPEWDFYGELFREYQPYVPEEKGRLGRPLDGEKLLADAGFQFLEETVVEQRLAVPDPDTFWNWAMSHGSRAFIDALPSPQREEFESRLRQELSTMNPITHPTAATLNRGTRMP